jgi:hypothetical protein
MLAESRFAGHFEFIGAWGTHFGLFDGCGAALPFDREQDGAARDAQSSGSCCG